MQNYYGYCANGVDVSYTGVVTSPRLCCTCFDGYHVTICFTYLPVFTSEREPQIVREKESEVGHCCLRELWILSWEIDYFFRMHNDPNMTGLEQQVTGDSTSIGSRYRLFNAQNAALNNMRLNKRRLVQSTAFSNAVWSLLRSCAVARPARPLSDNR